METQALPQESSNTENIILCSSCNYYIKSVDQSKSHYKSEFHRYNMKRKMVNLAPMSLEVFNQRKENTKIASQKQVAELENQVSILYCKICRKAFGCQNIYDQHMQSKKHQETKKFKEEKNEQKKNVIELKEKKEIISTLNDISVCLFCNEKSTDLNKNLQHMERKHGFFISETEYVIDISALIKYFAEKIQVGMLCLLCENKKTKAFKTPEAVQKHMMDKGHCFMQTDDFDEYEEFYNFTAKYKEYMSDSSEKDYEIQIESENENEKQDEDWEDVDEDEGKEKEDKTENQEKDKFRQVLQDKKKKAKKIIKIKKAKLLPSGELLLPNQKLLGHRTYKIYYRQYFRSLFKEKEQSLARLQLYRSELGVVKYSGNAFALMVQKQLFHSKYERKVVHQELKAYKRIQAKINAGSNNQKHFRRQMLV